MPDDEEGSSPLARMKVMAVQDVVVKPGMRHLELYTMRGLLTVLWHGPADAEAAVVACGGAMGGLLGPADGFFQWLGDELGERGIATLRVSYRKPNDLDACVEDAGAAAEMAYAEGVKRFVVMGHSFGGAVAVNCGAFLRSLCNGVVTLATQSAGCEMAMAIADKELLLVHGGRDRILPVMASDVVRQIAGTGELVVYPEADHLLSECKDELRELVLPWVERVLAPQG